MVGEKKKEWNEPSEDESKMEVWWRIANKSGVNQ